MKPDLKYRQDIRSIQGTEYGERVDPPRQRCLQVQSLQAKRGWQVGEKRGDPGTRLGVGGIRAVDMAADKPRLVGTAVCGLCTRACSFEAILKGFT